LAGTPRSAAVSADSAPRQFVAAQILHPSALLNPLPNPNPRSWSGGRLS